MRILGLDYGSSRIGVAVSDPHNLIARGIGTIKRENLKKDLEKIKGLVKEYEVGQIVLGLPQNIDGSFGKQAEKVKDFAKDLGKELKLPLAFQDERLTTWQAQRNLQEMGIKFKKGKKKLDQMAAAIILQDYLGKRKDEKG